MNNIRRIDSIEELERIRPAWSSLWERCARPTPFQTPEWTLAWLRARGARPVALAAERDGGLKGLAVFHLTEASPGGPVLEFAGTGASDYLDVLAEPDAEDEFAAAVLKSVGAPRADWELADMRQLRSGAPLVRIGASIPGSKLEGDAWCPVMSLEPGPGGLPRVVPSLFRKKALYAERLAAREARAAFARVEASDFESGFDAFLELRRARWAGRGAVDDDGAFNSTLRAAGGGAAAAGRLRLFILRLHSKPAGALLGFRAGRGFFFYIGGFDPAFARFSPGTLVIAHALRGALEEGCSEFDFLRGCEPYKFKWGAQPRTTHRLQLTPGRAAAKNSPRGREQSGGVEKPASMAANP